MNIPKLRKERTVKTYHGHELVDDYGWVDQPDILDVLKNPEKLLPEVKKYVEENDKINTEFFNDVKPLQKKLFYEIKNKIKLEDEGLKYKDKNYFYWSKVTKEGQYGKKLRQKIGSSKAEVYFDGDLEKTKHKSEYFGIAAIEVSHADEWCAFSLDLKGSEFFNIYLKKLSTGEIIKEKIQNTSGSIIWSLDDKSFFYSRLDKFHRPKQIFKHTLGYQCFSLYLKYKEKEKNNPEGVDIAKKVNDASEGLAMTVFLVTTRLSQITHSYTNSKSLGG